MSALLSNLVHNLSGKIFKRTECKKCMEREKINLECRFVKLKNNSLI